MAKSSTRIQNAVTSDLLKMFKSFHGQFDHYSLFNDFLTMGAVATSNAFDKAQFAEREAIYMQTVKGYTSEQLKGFARGLHVLKEALVDAPNDYLGELYMAMDLGNQWTGQFFTPMHICRLNAKLLMSDVEKVIEEKGFITLSDPCIGGGAMVIAYADELQQAGFNYPTQLYIRGQDIDIKAVYMSYIQLSWMGAGACVVHGDTLRNEQHSEWFTPWNVCYGWERRFFSSLPTRAPHIMSEEPFLKADYSVDLTLIADVNKEQLCLF